MHELRFWRDLKNARGEFGNDHYAYYFTTLFDLEPAFYVNKRILDLGCGPQGSLEWADMAAERVGLDPLANEYLRLGADRQKMRYVQAPSEKMPFETGHFDVVSSINSLDHVDNVDETIREIVRVLKPGGLFLLLTDVNHDPTDCEPQAFSWNIVEAFAPKFDLLAQQHLESSPEGHHVTARERKPYDHSNPAKRCAVLSAKFRRRDDC